MMKRLMDMGLSFELLDSLVENNTDAIYVIDKNMKIMYVNKAFENIFGWTKQELIGNGTFTIHSEENKGTTVDIRLPV